MLFTRMWRAARFDGGLYQELRQDPIAVVQALAALLLTILAVVLGALLDSQLSDRSVPASVARGLLLMPGLWLLPALSLFFLGGMAQNRRGHQVRDRDLLAGIGFSAAPGTLLGFLFIPGLDGVIALLVPLWMIASMVAAARALIGISVLRGIAFVAPGLLLYLFIGSISASG